MQRYALSSQNSMVWRVTCECLAMCLHWFLLLLLLWAQFLGYKSRKSWWKIIHASLQLLPSKGSKVVENFFIGTLAFSVLSPNWRRVFLWLVGKGWIKRNISFIPVFLSEHLLCIKMQAWHHANWVYQYTEFTQIFPCALMMKEEHNYNLSKMYQVLN